MMMNAYLILRRYLKEKMFGVVSIYLLITWGLCKLSGKIQLFDMVSIPYGPLLT